jgi:TatD DNase family protein
MDYIDIHSHLSFADYEGDREEVLARMRENNTTTITVGTDLESSKRAVELAEKYKEVYACIGIHPVDDPTRNFEQEEFEKLVVSPRVVAIGECGLDYFHADKTSATETKRQQELFIDQIQFALRHDKPLMIHSRAAYPELLDMLEPLSREYGSRLRGDVHFFAGDVEIAKRFLNIGFTLSFTGVVTFTRDYDEVIRFAPLDMIMSETDAPFVAPKPHRGKRNEPTYISEVVKKIAEIRGEEFKTVQKTLVLNAERVFGISLA